MKVSEQSSLTLYGIKLLNEAVENSHKIRILNSNFKFSGDGMEHEAYLRLGHFSYPDKNSLNHKIKTVSEESINEDFIPYGNVFDVFRLNDKEGYCVKLFYFYIESITAVQQVKCGLDYRVDITINTKYTKSKSEFTLSILNLTL